MVFPSDESIKQCCKPGVAWQGTPAGKEITIAGFPAYASPGYETSQAPVVVLITDVFGWQQKNLRLYCDRLEQAAGVRAVAPNILGDTAITEDQYPDAVPGFFKVNPIPERLKQVEQIVAACSSSKVGLLGFCWGAKTSVLASAKKGGKLAAVASNHPSLLEQKDVEAIATPVWFNFAGPEDPMVSPEQRVTYEKILSSKSGSGSQYFPDMNHGWTLKGDDKDAQVQKDAAKALENVAAFFKQHLA